MLLLAAAAAGARDQCRWKQTGGCSPDGRREPGHDRKCDAVVPSDMSGYCSCADGSRVAASHCNHKSLRCLDKCAEQATTTVGDTPAEAQPAREESVRSASPQAATAAAAGSKQLAFDEESCQWRQTGGCSSHGRREPKQDKDCSKLIGSSISGWCDCGQGRVAAKGGCGHTPFRCSKRCEKGAYTPRDDERQARHARRIHMITASDTCDHGRFPTPRCPNVPMPIAHWPGPIAQCPMQAMNRQERQGAKSRQSPRRRRRERKQQKKLQKQKQQKQKGNVSSAPRTAVEIATSNAARLRALARRGRIAVSHTNAGNLPFARNWFASLMRVGVPNWAIFATDEEAYDILHAEVPNRGCPSLSLRLSLSLTLTLTLTLTRCPTTCCAGTTARAGHAARTLPSGARGGHASSSPCLAWRAAC